MIVITKSPTADTRTCDFANVSKEALYGASLTHIKDVQQAIEFFRHDMAQAANIHDWDKLSDIDGFHDDFVTGFKQTTWWDAHRRLNRHHLAQEDGVPDDVNLMDVLEYIADCVMAGMARSGEVYTIEMNTDVLFRAFTNTVELLMKQVVVQGSVESDGESDSDGE